MTGTNLQKREANDDAKTPRFDELNLARLGLISIQERIPKDFTHWELVFDNDGLPAKLSCLAHAQYGGVPHGVDNDIMNAIIDLYLETGANENGDLTVTAHAILKRAGIDPNGRAYNNLHESLHRLRTAVYTAKDSWRDHAQKKWTTVTFTHLQQLSYTGDRENVARGTVIRLQLDPQIVKSIRAKYLKPLDAGLLAQIERPLARALYRLLDAKRYDPLRPDITAVALHVSLTDWAKECKLNFLEAKRIRRALDPAHNELIEQGYLKSAEYSGRGSAQQIHYVFGDGPTRGETLVARAHKHGIGLPVARDLLRRLGAEQFEERIAKAEHLLTRGYQVRSKPGFVVDVLKDDTGKYPDPQEFKSAVRAASDTPPKKNKMPEQEGDEIRQAEDAVRRHEQSIRDAGIDAQVEYAMERLTLLIGRHLDTRDLARVQSALRANVLDPMVVAREALKAVVENRVGSFLKELRSVTTTPPMLGTFSVELDE